MEVSRQLTSKEEEIIALKGKFKEERQQNEHDKKRMSAQVNDYSSKLEDAGTRYFNLKKDIEESPLALLRNELGQKQLEVVELESKVKNAYEARDEFRAKYDQVKKDMIGLKRHIDNEKEKALTKQANELEELKTMMKTKAAQDDEKRQFDELKSQLSTLQGRLTQHAASEADDANKRGSRSMNQSNGAMMQPDRSVYFDDFARKQASPTRNN